MGRHHLVAPGLDAAVALGELQLHLVGQRDAVLHRQLVERAGDRALHAGAVVAPDPEHERVVELAQLVDRVDHAADVVVGVLGVAGVDLHLAGVVRLELVRDVVPGGERVVAGRQLGVGGNHAERLLPGERLLAQLVPALVELALVLRRPLLGDVMRGVAAAGREVGEERLLRVLGPDRVQPLDRLVGHVVGQVVGVLLVVEVGGGADDLLVLGQARVPLARAAAEEAVEVVESPADRPAVERSGGALLAVRRQVPLAERRRAVAVVPQDPRERHAVVGDERRVAGEAGRELADRAEADRVAVAAGQQRRPRRRAERGDVEAVVPHAVLGHPRVVRRVDRAPEGPGVAEAGIVDQDHQDVRCPIGSIDVADQIPVRLRAVECPVGHAGNGCRRIGSLLRSGWLIIYLVVLGSPSLHPLAAGRIPQSG